MIWKEKYGLTISCKFSLYCFCCRPITLCFARYSKERTIWTSRHCANEISAPRRVAKSWEIGPRGADDSADLRSAINSVKGLLTVIPSLDDNVLATQRERLGKYVKTAFTLVILTDIVKQSEEIPNHQHQDENSLHEKIFILAPLATFTSPLYSL